MLLTREVEVHITLVLWRPALWKENAQSCASSGLHLQGAQCVHFTSRARQIWPIRALSCRIEHLITARCQLQYQLCIRGFNESAPELADTFRVAVVPSATAFECGGSASKIDVMGVIRFD